LRPLWERCTAPPIHIELEICIWCYVAHAYVRLWADFIASRLGKVVAFAASQLAKGYRGK
jgi:hypothetical protein